MSQLSPWFVSELWKMSFNRDTYTPAWDRFELCALLEEPVLETDESYLLEPVGLGYTRLYIPFTTAYWTVNDLGEVYNAQTHTWPAATGTWGPVVGYALIAASSGGGFTKQVAAFSDIAQQPRIVATNQLQLAAGQFIAGIYANS